MNEADVLARLKPLLEDDSVLKIGAESEIRLSDLPAARHPHRAVRRHDADVLCARRRAARPRHGRAVAAASAATRRFPSAMSPARARTRSPSTRCRSTDATRYSAEDADVTLRLLSAAQAASLREAASARVYETLERPLVPVLADMERAGHHDRSRSAAQALQRFRARSRRSWKSEIHKLAGEEFNIGSPKQLGDILFGKILAARRPQDQDRRLVDRRRCAGRGGGAGPRHRQEGAGLARAGQAARHLHRRAARPTSIRKTGRVHTSYAMAATSTGRLASTDPNLQNIPVRTEEGRRIRQAFIAPKGSKLISADYSQIELRLLAHIADIPQLKKAFADGLDIHAHDGVGDVRRAGQGHAAQKCAAAPRRSISASSTAFRRSASPTSSASRASEADDYIKKYFAALPGHPRLYGIEPRNSRASMAMSKRCSAGACISARSSRRFRACAAAPSAPRSTRRSRARPPTSSAAP